MWAIFSSIDKHFPPSSCLRKIFNHNSVKVSYSCMDNSKSIISKHNTRILSSPKSTTQTTSSTNSATCNCNNSNECPLQKKCLLDCIVYKAEVVTSNSEPKEYIGMTGNTFKKRLYNHNKSFNNVTYRNNTELSKYMWNLKKKQQDLIGLFRNEQPRILAVERDVTFASKRNFVVCFFRIGSIRWLQVFRSWNAVKWPC